MEKERLHHLSVLDFQMGPCWEWKKENGYHKCAKDTWALIVTDFGKFKFHIKEGFLTDGASVPWLFQWIYKSWYNDDRDVCAIIHDIAYQLKGDLGTILLSREAADDMLVNLLKLSKAVKQDWKLYKIDKAVQFAAGGPEHWGNKCVGKKDMTPYVCVERVW